MEHGSDTIDTRAPISRLRVLHDDETGVGELDLRTRARCDRHARQRDPQAAHRQVMRPDRDPLAG